MTSIYNTIRRYTKDIKIRVMKYLILTLNKTQTQNNSTSIIGVPFKGFKHSTLNEMRY